MRRFTRRACPLTHSKGETMQAIKAKIIGPTDKRGAVVVASCPQGRVVRPYNGEKNDVVTAVADLLQKLDWSNGCNWHGGDLDSSTWVFVATPAPRGPNAEVVINGNRIGYVLL